MKRQTCNKCLREGRRKYMEAKQRRDQLHEEIQEEAGFEKDIRKSREDLAW